MSFSRLFSSLKASPRRDGTSPTWTSSSQHYTRLFQARSLALALIPGFDSWLSLGLYGHSRVQLGRFRVPPVQP